MSKSARWLGAVVASVGVAGLGLGGCCMGGMGGSPAPVVTPVVAPVPIPPPTGVPFAVAPGLPEWNSGYGAHLLHDGTNTSYWCTGVQPGYPIVATLTLAPSAITGVDFDTRLPGYETSAVRVVTVEALGPTGAPLETQTVELNQNAISSLSFASPLTPTQVRLTFHSNFGGSYAGLGEVVLRTGAPTGIPVRPAAPPPIGIPYTVAAGLPVWNDGYSAARMQDQDASTYWCTPSSPRFPFTGNLTLAAPTPLRELLFDNRLPGYETSGIRGVTVNVFGAAGELLSTASAELPQNAATVVPLPVPVTASRLDVVFRSNHGGTYAGLVELQLR